jgi:glutathione S-transferase
VLAATGADESKSLLGQLPCLTDGEITVGQSGAILRYLIRKFKIQMAASNADQAMSEEMIEAGVDLLAMGVKAHYPAGGDRTAAMDELFAPGGADKSKNICAMFALLEATIKDSGFFGKSPMPGDACIASNLRIMSDLQPDCLDAFPKLKALLAKFDGHAGVQKHIANYPYPYLKRQSD